MVLPEEYIIQKFQSYCGGVKFLKYQNAYNGSCYLCKEGNSWLKKKRCYYLVDDNIICCHNCGWYGKPLYWIREVSNLSISEILEESKSFEFIPASINVDQNVSIKPKLIDKLPHDSINILDKQQLFFYESNKIVKDIIQFIEKRCIPKAAYKPSGLFISLTDWVHKNRLILPFYDDKNNIIFYQSRAIYDEDLKNKAKYISKIGGEKSLFNYNLIDTNFEYIFLLEGPINAFFCKNGVAVGGIQESSQQHLTSIQQKQLLKYAFHNKIWVPDSQWIDEAGRKKSFILADQGHSIFIWPKGLGEKYKDFNDIIISLGIKQIDPDFIIKNTYKGLQAKIKLSQIKR